MTADKINLKKPVALLKREMTFDWKNIFIHSGKTIGSFFVKGADGAALAAADLANDLGLKQPKEQLAWILVFQAMMSNLNNIINDSLDLFAQLPSDKQRQQLGENLSDLLSLSDKNSKNTSKKTYHIDNQFFEQPQNAPFVQDFIPALKTWLQQLGLNDTQSQMIANRYRANFPLSLHNQWASNNQVFKTLTDNLQTPFSQASHKTQQWRNYHLWLTSQIHQRMLGEAFSLNDIYIKPKAYYVENAYTKNEEDLHQTLTQWASNFKPDDAFRVVSGGPGAGKSSMAQMLAVNWGQTLGVPVLLIPLHHFNMSTSIVSAVNEFITNKVSYLTHNPIDPSTGEQRLILIFDGLDELAEQGKQAQEMARDFVMLLSQEVRLLNSQGKQIQALLTGRDISTKTIVSSYFKAPQQSYYLLGFDQTQQNLWWQQYGNASGKNYQHMPEELQIDRLREVVAQPLLSYLVALSFVRGKITFNQQTSLNQIYQDLLNSVFEREHKKNIRNIAMEITGEQFNLILEQIALAIWHGHGRTATVTQIKAKCGDRLLAPLSAFQHGAENGVTKLLTAFYFRQANNNTPSDKTFEFTHKSFGEFLIAKRLVRLVKRLSLKFEQSEDDPEDDWSPKKALVEWIKITGPSPIDRYLHPFIIDEIALAGLGNCKVWQQQLLTLLNYSINQGLPMEKIEGLSYPQMCTQARNADESLLVLLNACALVTKKHSKIAAKEEIGFGQWFRRLQLQRDGDDNCVAYNCLSYLDINKCVLYGQDFYKANLNHSNLSDAYLADSDLAFANLPHANLTSTHLNRSNLTNANLKGANLTNANLKGANLTNTNLTNADLTNAKVNFHHHDKSIFSEEQLQQMIKH